jgi:uncharacterized membrane protein YqaE (UPF0057 family)
MVDDLRRRRFLVDLLRILVAILLPPLGVFLQVGIGKHFWINILLKLLDYNPGHHPRGMGYSEILITT